MTDDHAPSKDRNGEEPVGRTGIRPASDPGELARIATELLPSLIARFGESKLGEMEIRRDGWRIRMRGGEGGRRTVAVETAPRARVTSARASARRKDDASETDRGRIAVTSPAVGYFQPAKGLQVGQRVRSGDVVGQVDMLGVRHDAVAGSDAMVSRVMAETGEAVEYGQELMRLERSTSDRSTGSGDRSAGSSDRSEASADITGRVG